MSEEKGRITVEDLYRLQIVSDPQISPDGEHIIFCVQHVDQKTEKKHTNLWLVDANGGDPASSPMAIKRTGTLAGRLMGARSLSYLTAAVNGRNSSISSRSLVGRHGR